MLFCSKLSNLRILMKTLTKLKTNRIKQIELTEETFPLIRYYFSKISPNFVKWNQINGINSN